MVLSIYRVAKIGAESTCVTVFYNSLLVSCTELTGHMYSPNLLQIKSKMCYPKTL